MVCVPGCLYYEEEGEIFLLYLQTKHLVRYIGSQEAFQDF